MPLVCVLVLQSWLGVPSYFVICSVIQRADRGIRAHSPRRSASTPGSPGSNSRFSFAQLAVAVVLHDVDFVVLLDKGAHLVVDRQRPQRANTLLSIPCSRRRAHASTTAGWLLPMLMMPIVALAASSMIGAGTRVRAVSNLCASRLMFFSRSVARSL